MKIPDVKLHKCNLQVKNKIHLVAHMSLWALRIGVYCREVQGVMRTETNDGVSIVYEGRKNNGMQRENSISK